MNTEDRFLGYCKYQIEEIHSPVYRYDQMNAYKHGFEKDADWNEAVNDPKLGYDDAW